MRLLLFKPGPPSVRDQICGVANTTVCFVGISGENHFYTWCYGDAPKGFRRISGLKPTHRNRSILLAPLASESSPPLTAKYRRDRSNMVI